MSCLYIGADRASEGSRIVANELSPLRRGLSTTTRVAPSPCAIERVIQSGRRLKGRTKAILHADLIQPYKEHLFGKAGRRWFDALPLPPEERGMRQRLIAELEHVRKPARESALECAEAGCIVTGELYITRSDVPPSREVLNAILYVLRGVIACPLIPKGLPFAQHHARLLQPLV